MYVDDGHDEENKVLRSVLAYDPNADALAQLPDIVDKPHGLYTSSRSSSSEGT